MDGSQTPPSLSGSVLSSPEIDSLIEQLSAIRADLLRSSDGSAPGFTEFEATYRESARNLMHYLALRRRDLRPLQMQLARFGLSSLGRAEPCVLSVIDAVLNILHALAQRPRSIPADEPPAIDLPTGSRLLAEHSEMLFGPSRAERNSRIMVTMPTEAAEDYSLVHDLVQQGMDCMRINCAHDDEHRWLRMIEHLRRAEKAVGRSCKLIMDLGGPKLRTGPLVPGPAVIRIRPERDVFGRVVCPARVWFHAMETPHGAPSPADGCIPVPASWLARLQVGDTIHCLDARKAKRKFHVIDRTDYGVWAESRKTAYLVPGIVLEHHRHEDRHDRESAEIGAIPPRENGIVLRVGDLLVLTRNVSPGRPATFDEAGKVLKPATIGCTLPEVFNDVHTGEPIWFDDGKIGGVIEKIQDEGLHVRIQHARVGGEKLRSDKGINLPESSLHLPALTPKDLNDLPFIAKHADMVALSFANHAKDVQSLNEHLIRLGERRPAIVLKIETRRGFTNLPTMLLAAMKTPCCGVMIARGDLAVECGFERLAEVQEEILWFCEAAHIPVIWATQVLDTLAREGIPTRAEISDAAMAHRAECVMLNKGPHIVEAVKVLDDILRRMQTHQSKKRSMLRELRLAHLPPPT